MATPPPPAHLGPRIEAHVRELASEAYGGRAPGTPGGEAAAAYIEGRLRAAGLEPAGSDGFRQPVPLLGVRTLPAARLTWSAGRGERGPSNAPISDFIAGWNQPREAAMAEGEATFVGHGIVAEELGRDDLAGADLRGRWAVALDGAPPSTPGMLPHSASQPAAKLRAAHARGAVGLLLLCPPTGWPEPHELGRKERVLPSWGHGDPEQPIPWVAVGGSLVASLSGGRDLWSEGLRPAVPPRPLDLRLRLELVQEVRPFESPNLIARLPGRDPTLASLHLCLSAHYDGLGRAGDRVYPGVIDNAVGVGELLAAAEMARAEGPSRRSLLFLFPTAEEAGLLGSRYFVEHPTLPLAEIVGCLNKDGAPEVWGRARDVVAIAAHAAPSFGAALQAAVTALGLGWSPNPFPSEGFFFRSDHYSFLRAGVPATLLFLGLDFAGRPPTWGVGQALVYLRDHYHRPSDDLSRVLSWEGPAQYASLWLALARALAEGEELPREEIHLPPHCLPGIFP